MKRIAWGLALVGIAVAAAQTPTWGHRAMLENASWVEAEEEVVEQRIGWSRLGKDFAESAQRAKARVETCVRAVFTVAKALANAARAVVVSIVGFVVRFAFALALAVAQWLLGLFAPV